MLTANLNTQGGPLSRLCRALLRLFGWQIKLVWPPLPKAVVIVYPHTSNWDFVVGILARSAIAIPIRFVGKDWLSLSGNEAEDLAEIRAYYADKRGKKPAPAGDIRFR